jgi:hypothetical protein
VTRAMADVSDPLFGRLRRLEGQLRGFCQDRPARVLAWVLAPDERRLFEGFLALERDRADSGRVLIASDEPFRARGTHGVALVRSLEVAARERASALTSEDTYDIPWRAPNPPRELARKRGAPPPDLVYLRDALLDFEQYALDAPGTLVVCLRPKHVENLEEYARWLSDLGFLLVESQLRVVAVASSEQNFGPALALANPQHVRVATAALDMPGALQEIAALSEDANLPSGRYRRSFLEASHALGAGNLAAALAPAERARHIARTESWSHLEFAVNQLLAGGALGVGDLKRAFVSFDDAERATHHDIRFGATWLSPALLQARLGKGAVALMGHAWKLGARLFADEALPVARAMNDHKAELECLRLAAYCEERAGDEVRARMYVEAALATGKLLPLEERRRTTLAHVGEARLRFARGLGQRGERAEIERTMTALLGKDWHELATPGSAAPALAAAFAARLVRAEPEHAAAAAERSDPSASPQTATLTEALTRTLTAAIDLPLIDRGSALLELPARAPLSRSLGGLR